MITNRLTKQNCTKLLTGQLSAKESHKLLAFVKFDDWEAAYQSLQKMASTPALRQDMVSYLPHLLVALSNAAGPDRVLGNIVRFSHAAPSPADFSRYLAQNPRAIEILVAIFAGSQFLTEILLRNYSYFDRLAEHRSLAQAQSYNDFYAKACAAIAPFTNPDDQLDALRRLQRWQLLRIGAGDLLGLFDMPTTTAQLSHLADSLIQVCLDIAAQQTSTPPEGFVVLGMGKLGGQELNYSSDIDLLFLGQSSGDHYLRLGKYLIDALTRATAEGFLYRVDMRLRPWGKLGALVTSVDGHIAYLHQHARLWEKQALLKARIVAGDVVTGQNFLQQVEPLIFVFDKSVVQTDVRAMKVKIEENLRRHGKSWGEVKLGEGSIRDIEFLVQYLQLAYGGALPQVRSRNTLDALNRLAAHSLINQDEYRVLSDGYTFLRSVEHWLQMMHYRQTHTLPTDPVELNNLARRLGFQNADAGTRFLDRFERHTIAIRLIYDSYLGGHAVNAEIQSHKLADVQKHLSRLSAGYVATFSAEDIERHAILAERITPENLVELETIPLEDGRWQITVVGYDYPGVLSLICGLFFAHGFDIHAGNVFTYRPQPQTLAPTGAAQKKPWQTNRFPKPATPSKKEGRQKIVDVFIVSAINNPLPPDVWPRYAADLTSLVAQLETGRRNEAQGKLAKQLAALYQKSVPAASQLYPVDIEINNNISEHTTVLQIDALDTVGFLYEFTNALALAGIQIDRVSIGADGNRVHDIVYVTDAEGNKITDPVKLRALRAATVLTKHFTHLLPQSPNPEAALIHFSQFLQQLFARPNWPDELISLERPKVLNALAQLLGVSSFLWTDFFRMQYENLFPVVRNTNELADQKPKTQLGAELTRLLRPQPDLARRQEALNAFKDREMFRIDMRHILGYTAKFGQFSAELTDLAEVIVNAAFDLAQTELIAQYGRPTLEETGRPCPVSVCALGKCGGRELGFASDIELIFIYAGKGKTDGEKSVSNAWFFEKLVRSVLEMIQARREGIFEIDLRLRPYGKAGSLAVALDSFRAYYAPDGPAWAYERQALVKLRPLAGDADLGEQIVACRDKIVYTGAPFDVAAMRGMRERQVRHLVTPGAVNAKHSPGGLVDVEYLVQGLQITHGADNPSLRNTNTREAITALAQAGILSTADYDGLRKALNFLRRLINALRIVHGNAKDLTIPPAESDEFAFLARRLAYGNDLARFSADLSYHFARVQEINTRLLR